MGSNLVALRHLNAAAVGGERVIERHVHLFLGLCVLTLMHQLIGCGTPSRQAVTEAPPPLIALLPLENHSNDIDAPMKVRKELHGAMSEQGYRLVDLDRIDGSLKDISVTLGVQARLLEGKPEVLGRLIPADIYCFGAVVEFAFKSAAALTMRKVEIELKLIEAKSGDVLFEGRETGITTRAGLDAAGELILNLAGKVVKSVKDSATSNVENETVKKTGDATDIVADVNLVTETREAIRKLLRRFPEQLSAR